MGLFEEGHNMRYFASLVLLSSISFGALASAQACDDTGFVKAADGYILRTVGAVASDEPVIQMGAARTCGNWTFDTFASYGSAGGTANELDFSVFYGTEAGPFRVQFAASYYLVNLDDSMLDASDDLVEVYADVSLPLSRGRLTVAPLLRVGELIGVDDLPSLTMVQPGVRASYRITDSITASGEYRASVNLTQDYTTHQFAGALTWQVSDRTALRLGYEDTDRTRDVFSLGANFNF